MGKTLIQQARGHGSLSYRVPRQAYCIKPGYPSKLDGEYEVVKLVNSTGHSAPIAKLRSTDGKTVFYNFAAGKMYEGQKIKFGGENEGDINILRNLKNGTMIYNIENKHADGGKFVRTGGNSAIIVGRKDNGSILVALPSKQEKEMEGDCRVTIGVIAGGGRLEKPFLKAGVKRFHMKSRNKLWPRTSAVKMNAIDHPFGSGRGKRIKPKIAKNNSPPGAKVGMIHPRRTGRLKK